MSARRFDEVFSVNWRSRQGYRYRRTLWVRQWPAKMLIMVLSPQNEQLLRIFFALRAGVAFLTLHTFDVGGGTYGRCFVVRIITILFYMRLRRRQTHEQRYGHLGYATCGSRAGSRNLSAECRFSSIENAKNTSFYRLRVGNGFSPAFQLTYTGKSEVDIRADLPERIEPKFPYIESKMGCLASQRYR